MEICDAADRGEILPAPNPDALPPPPTYNKQQGKQKKSQKKSKKKKDKMNFCITYPSGKNVYDMQRYSVMNFLYYTQVTICI